MQQRREEILAKKVKLAELKRQRELRRAESASRQSMTGSPLGEVGTRTLGVTKQRLTRMPGPFTNAQTQRRPRP